MTTLTDPAPTRLTGRARDDESTLTDPSGATVTGEARDDVTTPTHDHAAAAPVIAVRDLEVRLGGTAVLRAVDLTVGPGEIVALLGGNGSGKTTLLRALLRLTAHHAGTIELFGVPQARFTGWPRLGYVPQRASIALHATTLTEIVQTGRLARRHGAVSGLVPFLHRRADAAIVTGALRQVDLHDQAKEPFIHLSGGQQQRALLARALAQEPDVLILDEPLAGVDLAHQATIHDTLARFRDGGGAVLVVLHETDVLAPLIDRAVVLGDGRVIADGPLPPPHPHHGHELEAPPRPAGLTTGMETTWRTPAVHAGRRRRHRRST